MAEGGLGAFTDSLLKFIPGAEAAKSVIDGLDSSVSQLLNSFRENVSIVEEYRIKLTQSSGAGSGFIDVLRKQTYELNKYGVSLNNVVAANVAMAESYSRATFSAAQTRDEFEKERLQVQKLITVNEKFGASSSQTIEILNKLGNSVFTNVGQVSKFSDTLLRFSKETGQSFSKTLTEFNSYYDRFITSLDSDKAIKSFTTLELLARRSGTSVSTLVSSISKFDDIDEAFSSGGQINRVLSQFGGSFDTLAAANASEEEKAQMLLQSISDIKDRFNTTMTNPNARRQVLKELQSQTGLPIEVITGLLKDGQTLSKDLQSIIKTPVTTKMEAISDKDKAKMAMDVTTAADVNKIAMENMTIGPLTTAMERMVTNNKEMIVDISSKIGPAVDTSFKQVLEGKSSIGTFLTQLNEAGTKVTEVIKGQDLVQKIMGASSFSEIPGAIVKSFQDNIGGVASDKVIHVYDEHVKRLAVRDAEREKQDDIKNAKYKTSLTEGVTEGVLQGIRKGEFKVTVTGKIVDKSGKTIGELVETR